MGGRETRSPMQVDTSKCCVSKPPYCACPSYPKLAALDHKHTQCCASAACAVTPPGCIDITDRVPHPAANARAFPNNCLSLYAYRRSKRTILALSEWRAIVTTTVAGPFIECSYITRVEYNLNSY